MSDCVQPCPCGFYGDSLKPSEKRYCSITETCARRMLGDAAFYAALEEEQKMSPDAALDLALKTVMRYRMTTLLSGIITFLLL